MASLKEIAVRCGVSVASVSKALNDHKDIGAETKERIRQVAKEMGYLPNAQARALKTNRTYNIGVLFEDEAQSGLTHDYFAQVLNNFKRKVEENGYDITFINANTKGRKNLTLLEHCKYRGFDGVIIACVDFNKPQVLELVQSDLPVVTIDHIFNNQIAIISDNVKGMQDLLEFVYQQGHRKIAFIHGTDSSVTQARVSSFYRTAERLGLEVPEDYVIPSAYRSTSLAKQATEKLLDLPDPPTCIIYPDDFASFGGINAIRERGLRIPEDISIAGYDGIKVGRHIEPQLTTLRQNTEEMGIRAATELISLIEKPKTTLIGQVIIEGTVFPGKTVKRLL